MTDRLAELGALRYAAENTATHATSPNRLAAAGYIHAAFAEYQTWAAANPGINPSRLSAKGRLFGYFYDNATFSPLSLFAASEQGAWYDPSDLSTMFQDSAGTTPVTADGQPVGKILDKSGRGNHATQATAASRPLYKTDGTLHWLQFDGVDDSLSTAAIDFTGTDKVSVFIGLKKNADAAAIVLELSESTSNQGMFYLVSGEDAGSRYSSLSKGSMLADFSQAAFWAPSNIAPDTAVIVASHDIANDLSRIRRNAVYGTNGTGDKGTGNFGNYPLFIGSRAGNSALFNGNIYSLIIRGALSSTQEITDTETWVAAKTGVFF